MVKYQTVVSPDGLILSLIGAYPGNRHDSFMLRHSQLERVCLAHVPRHPRGPRLKMYGDMGYRDSDAIMTGFRGNGLPRDIHNYNAQMSTMRCVRN